MSEREYLVDRLRRIEAAARKVLKEAGYPDDPESLSMEPAWTRLQHEIRASELPTDKGVRASRALKACLLAQTLLPLVEAAPDELLVAIRRALDLGVYQDDLLGTAQLVTVNRHAGARRLGPVNAARVADKRERQKEIHALASVARAEYSESGRKPSLAQLARIVKHRGSSRIRELSLRTISNCLARRNRA